jgi:hypothetical protein
MQQLPTIDDHEQSKRQQIINTVLTSVENFRIDATKSYSNLSNSERLLLESIETDNIDSYSVLSAWQQDLRPIQRILHEKRSDDAFAKLLVKNILLTTDETQPKIDQIITRRETEVLHNFTNNIYTKINGKKKIIYTEQIQHANKLLSKPESEINQIRNHQIDYMLYKEIANQNNITVVDSHTSFFRRLKANARIKSERKKTIKSENERLLFIDNRLESLSAINGGLIVEVFKKKWDLITIFSLRNQYDKKINKLSDNDANNAIKKLAIFDAETQKFKNEQTEKLSINSDQVNLETTRFMTKDIDNLILRIFDLTTIQKNQLLLYSKEYRQLIQEKTDIINLQNDRSMTATTL